MREVAVSTFTEGLAMDMNPLSAQNSCLTDCLNGTIITYNGNEYTLQNDMGNVKLNASLLSAGYIPLGMKEYGGIIYLATLNPLTGKCQVGSIPSPDFSTTPNASDLPAININSSENIEGDKTHGYQFLDYFIKLFERELLQINPGDKYFLLYKINQNNDIIANNLLYDVEFYAVDNKNRLYKLEHIPYEKVDTITSDFSKDKYLYFEQTMSSILALKVSLNRIDFFEAWGACKNDIATITITGSNKIRGAFNHGDDDLIIRGVKVDISQNTELTLSESKLNLIIAKYSGIHKAEAADYLDNYDFKTRLLIDFSEIDEEDRNKDIVFEITPYDDFSYLDNLKRSVTINVSTLYREDDTDVFMYKYSLSNKRLTLKFNLPTLLFENPKMFVEFYNVRSKFSTIVRVDDVNPTGLNTMVLDVSGIKSEDLEKVTKDYQGEYGKILSDKIRINSNLIPNELYLVRIYAYDDVVENGQEDKNKFYYLIINENYNDLYDYDLENSINENFNDLNYNTDLDCTLSLDHLLTDLIIKEEADNNFTLDTNGFKYEVHDDPISEYPYITDTAVYKTTGHRNSSFTVTGLTADSFMDVSIPKKIKIKSIDASNLVIKDSLGYKNNGLEIDFKDMEIDFNLYSNKDLSASIKQLRKAAKILKCITTMYERLTKLYYFPDLVLYAKAYTHFGANYQPGNSWPKIIFDSTLDDLDDFIIGKGWNGGNREEQGHVKFVYPLTNLTHDIIFSTRTKCLTGDSFHKFIQLYRNLGRRYNGMFFDCKYSIRASRSLIGASWLKAKAVTERVFGPLASGGLYIDRTFAVINTDLNFKLDGSEWIDRGRDESDAALGFLTNLSKSRSYFLWLAFINSLKTTVMLAYTTMEAVLQMMNDLKVAKYTEKDMYLYYYSNLNYEPTSTVSLTGSYDATFEFTTDVSIDSCDSVLKLNNKLTGLIEDKLEVLALLPGTYFELGDKTFYKSSSFQAPNISFLAMVSVQDRSDILNSLLDLEDNNPEIYNPSKISSGIVFSESGHYSNSASKFIAEYDEDENTFDFYFNYNKTGVIPRSGGYWKSGGLGGSETDGPNYIEEPVDS